MRPTHERSTQWRWICFGASLAKGTSRKFKASLRPAISRTACGTPLSRISGSKIGVSQQILTILLQLGTASEPHFIGCQDLLTDPF